MPLPGPMRGSRSMGAAADMVAAIEGKEGVRVSELQSFGSEAWSI